MGKKARNYETGTGLWQDCSWIGGTFGLIFSHRLSSGKVLNMNNKILPVAVTLFAASTALAQQAVQWKYLPELADRYYGIRDDTRTIWNGAFLEGCYPETVVPFAWHGTEGPRYVIYEITGTIVKPTFEWTQTPIDGANPEVINFNCFTGFHGGGGRGFGMNFGANNSWSNSDFRILYTYDQTSGRVYGGAVFSLSEAERVNFSFDKITVVQGFALNFFIPLDNLRYFTPGSVHVESVRVGISDQLYVLGSEPLTPLSNFPTCDGDLTQDCSVDGQDLAFLLSVWGGSKPAADLDGDGIVDGVDLAIMLSNWGSCPN